MVIKTYQAMYKGIINKQANIKDKIKAMVDVREKIDNDIEEKISDMCWDDTIRQKMEYLRRKNVISYREHLKKRSNK